MFDYSKGYVFFTFSMGYIHIDIYSQIFYELRKDKNISCERLRLYLNEKKKIVEGHIDIDHLIRKGEIISITEEEIKKIELQT